MGAVSFQALVDLRTRLRSAVLLALAIGIAGGATLAALAGARRTQSAVDRFVVYSHPAQADVADVPDLYAQIARLPEVAFSARSARFAMLPINAANKPVLDFTLGEVALDDLGLSRGIVVAGRLPRSDRVGEVLINASAATNRHLAVGDTLQFQAFGAEQSRKILQGSTDAPTGPRVKVDVVGVVRLPADLSAAQATPGVSYTGQDTAIFTPRFLREYERRVAILGGVGQVIWLNGGEATFPRFAAKVERLSAGKAKVYPGGDDLDAAAQARHATNVEALALFLFGLLAAAVTLTLIAQAFARAIYLQTEENYTLRAMGMTRKQLVAATTLRAALISAVGAVLALGVAVLASPFMPIGLARQAEVHRGYSFDGLAIVTGIVAITALLTGWSAIVAWRATGRARAGRSRSNAASHASRVGSALSRAGSPPSATVGAAMAFESGRGSNAVPARTALASAVTAIAVVVGALTFGANLARLAGQPRLQGWNWDVAVGNPHSDDVAKTAVPLLAHNADVGAFSLIAGTEAEPVRIQGRDAMLFGIDAVKGADLVPYTAGRAPKADNEIAFGSRALSDLHRTIGQRVRVAAGGRARSMLITGRVLLTPAVVNNQMPLGYAAVATTSGLHALDPSAAASVFLVRFRPHVDRAAALRKLRADFPGTVLGPARPPDIENLQRVNHLPGLLAGLFALIALLTVGNTLVSSVRRRRRDIAVLRTIGFVRRQVSATVAWQATMVALVAIVIGLPVGAAAGRVAWGLVTHRLGLPGEAVVPVTLLGVVAVAALFAANLIAVVPGFFATRTPPAKILHAE